GIGTGVARRTGQRRPVRTVPVLPGHQVGQRFRRGRRLDPRGAGRDPAGGQQILRRHRADEAELQVRSRLAERLGAAEVERGTGLRLHPERGDRTGEVGRGTLDGGQGGEEATGDDGWARVSPGCYRYRAGDHGGEAYLLDLGQQHGWVGQERRGEPPADPVALRAVDLDRLRLGGLGQQVHGAGFREL